MSFLKTLLPLGLAALLALGLSACGETGESDSARAPAAQGETAPETNRPEDTGAQETSRIAGTWRGTVSISGTSLPLVLNIEEGEDGTLTATLDSPDQAVFGVPTESVTLIGKGLTVELPAIGGRYVGTLSEDGQTLDGMWTQGTISVPLVMTKGEAEVLNRPQTPQPPFAYSVEDVRYPSRGEGVELAGTLTLPEGEGPFPAVVLVSGSGPQDRDETIMEHKPFLVLADHLTNQGIAVLRFDDRGFGASTGDFAAATTDDFVLDAMGGVDFLRAHQAVNGGKVGIVGHSEGGLVAIMAGAEHAADLDFLVLMAAVGVPMDEVILAQIRAMGEAGGMNPIAIEQTIAVQRKLLELVEQAETPQAARAAVIEYFTASGMPEDRAAQQADAIATPWMKRAITIDPAAYAQRIEDPTLVLNGTLDQQVLFDQNVPPIEAALQQAGVAYRVERMEGLNHLFQRAETGHINEYRRIEETIAPEVLEVIAGWIGDQATN